METVDSSFEGPLRLLERLHRCFRGLNLGSGLMNGLSHHPLKISIANFERFRSDLSSLGGSVGRVYSCSGLLMSIVSVEAGNQNQRNRANRLNPSRPMLWITCGLLYLASLGLVTAAFIIAVTFGTGRRGWGWGLLRCIGIFDCVYIAFHLIWYALSLGGA